MFSFSLFELGIVTQFLFFSEKKLMDHVNVVTCDAEMPPLEDSEKEEPAAQSAKPRGRVGKMYVFDISSQLPP